MANVAAAAASKSFVWLCYANQSILQPGSLTGFAPAFVLPFLSLSLTFILSLAGGFSVTWLCYTNFNGPTGPGPSYARPARHPPCVAATAIACRLLLSLSVVAPKRFAFCLFCVNLKSALVMRLQQQQQRRLSSSFPTNCWHLQLLGCHSSSSSKRF